MIVMKKFLLAAAAVCMAALAISCTGHLDNPTGDESGLLYGTWVMDDYRFDAGGTVDGEGGNIPVPVPYIQHTTLRFEEAPLVVYAKMGWETSQSEYTVDNEKKTIKLARMMEVSDDGQVLAMGGTFDIVELTLDKLTLRQPYSDFSINVGDKVVTSKVTATYYFHRQK